MSITQTAFTAKTLHGLEDLLVEELTALGAKEVEKSFRVVYFKGDQALLYRANLQLRTALRILLPIYKFDAFNERQLYDQVKEVDWSTYTSSNDTIAVDTTVHSDYFQHSHYISLKTKDAIVDQFREKTGKRPSVDINDPSLRIHVHIHKEKCTISLDSSGQSLHKRSYRVSHHQAPLNEVLAAGMVLLTGWRGERPFFNPMSGSATLLIEAAMIAQNIAPNLLRENFGFQNWRDFDFKLWRQIREEAREQQTPCTVPLIGCDVNKNVVKESWLNINKIGFEDLLKVKRSAFEDYENEMEGGVMVMNPPYGLRMEKEDIEAFYKAIGDKLKADFSGFDAWILSANKEALKSVGLRPSRKIELYNGQLPCKFQKYEMYRGSKKAKHQVKPDTEPNTTA